MSADPEGPPVTSLTLISHASTRALRRAAFPADESLDPSAFRKAAGARPLHRTGQAWTGPERRAVQTAEALALKATIEPALRDCDYGRWAGRSLAALQLEEPEAVSAWLGDPGAAPHGGESIGDVLGRVASWLDTLAQRGGRFVGVTHPAIVRAAITHAIGGVPSSFWRIDVAPLTLASLRARGGRWTLRASGSPISSLASGTP